MTRFKLTALLFCALLVIAIAGCRTPSDDPDATGASTAAVTRSSLDVEVSASGNLTFSQQEELAFEMAGTVGELYVEVGDSVTEGQIVATLDTSGWENQLRSLRIAVLSAETSVKQAEHALEQAKSRTATSITGDIVIRDCCDDSEIEIRELQLEVALRRLEDARMNLEESLMLSPEIVAPFDGFVTRVNIEGGDEVMKGLVGVTMADPDRFEAIILVNERDIAQVNAGTRARVRIDAIPGAVVAARVTSVSPTATIQGGVVNYEVKVELDPLDDSSTQTPGTDEGPSGELSRIHLREGLSVTVTLLVAERTDVLLVPNAAIRMVGDQPTVTVVLSDGREDDRAVSVGLSDWQYTEVLDGLSEGEVVRTTGVARPDQSVHESGNSLFPHGSGGPPR